MIIICIFNHDDSQMSLFVCVFLFVPHENFTHMETSPLPVKSCKLTCARDSWPLSSEGSLTCHTYCDTGHSFIMVISEDPWHSLLLLSVSQWSCHYPFLRLTQPSACEANAIAHCAIAAVSQWDESYFVHKSIHMWVIWS